VLGDHRTGLDALSILDSEPDVGELLAQTVLDLSERSEPLPVGELIRNDLTLHDQAVADLDDVLGSEVLTDRNGQRLPTVAHRSTPQLRKCLLKHCAFPLLSLVADLEHLVRVVLRLGFRGSPDRLVVTVAPDRLAIISSLPPESSFQISFCGWLQHLIPDFVTDFSPRTDGRTCYHRLRSHNAHVAFS
jgi:hypothetical protein